jgi:hypothetical protein
MQRLLLVALPVLAVAAGMFFVGTTPPVPPLAVGVVGVTNREIGGLVITVLVTNLTSRRFLFDATVLMDSNGFWSSANSDYCTGGDFAYAEPRGITQTTVKTHETPAVVRFRVQYWRLQTAREQRLDEFWQKLGLHAAPVDRDGQIMTTDPIALLAP